MSQMIQAILIAIMLIYSPLVAGGKSINTLLFLEIIGSLLLGLVLWQKNYKGSLNTLTGCALLFGLMIPIVYLIPLPESWWLALPERASYLSSLHIYQEQTSTLPWLSMSLVPEKTVHACLALIPLVAAFLSVVGLNKNLQQYLVYLLIGITTLQSIFGIIQYSTQSIIWTARPEITITADAMGTYINRDHFVALLYLTLPLVMGLFIHHLYATNDKKTAQHEYFITSSAVVQRIVFVIIILLLLIAAAFSRSRAGIFLIILGFFLCFMLFARQLSKKSGAGLASFIIILSIGVISTVGLIPILNRFIAADPFEDARWEFFRSISDGIVQFFPTGTGPSTFQEIFRTIQPVEQLNFLNHAHNDYLELLFETGILGALFIGLFFASYLYGWLAIRKYAWGLERFLKAGAGISILLILLHAVLDFNFHTPANALVAAFLLGIFLGTKKPAN